jgi:hypothetical protein
MRNYKNQHFNHHRAVLEHFLKVGEARLYKLFEFALFGASTADHYEILRGIFLKKSFCHERGILVLPTRGER